MSLPKEYETSVAELGSSLSAGERQRIALARAFLHQAPCILLDEPTSSLDVLNEAMILKSLKEQKDTTILLVTHRQATLRIAEWNFAYRKWPMSAKTKRSKEKAVIEQMIALYCRKNHKQAMCEDCQRLLEYACQRIDCCPFMETKSFCSNCKVTLLPKRNAWKDSQSDAL